MQFPREQLIAVDLTNRAVYEAIIDATRDRIIHNNITALLRDIDFIEQWYPLHPTFATEYPDRAEELNQLMIEARWITLPGHTKPDQTLPLFHQHINALFVLQDRHGIPREDVDLAKDLLTEELRLRLVIINNFDERDAFKKQLYEALLSNEEEITTAPFYRQLRQLPPTIKNWFSEYIEYMSSAEFVERRFQDFFVKNENAQRLAPDEREKLKLLFRVYQQLHLSSWKEEGIEEEVDIDVDDGRKTGKIIYGKVYVDDPKLKEQSAKFVKDYRELLRESGYTPMELYDLEPRPPVTLVEARMLPRGTIAKELTKGPDIEAIKGPDYFAKADEAEIKEHSELLPKLARRDDTTGQAAQFKQQLNLTFTTPEEEKRFTDLLISVLRGLRDSMELSQYLVDLHYPQAHIEMVTKAVKDLLKGKTVKRPTQERAATPSAQAPTMAQVQQEVSAQPQPVSPPPSPTEIVEPPPQTTEPKKSFLPKLRRSRLSKRPIIDDVKLKPAMVMGPVDELRAMDLLEFRRLSPNPLQAASRIKDKIDLLAEESVSRQAEGIQAFKVSPLNSLYVELGNQSIATGQPVTELIASREAKGTPTLSVEEFTAIADLNKHLRF